MNIKTDFWQKPYPDRRFDWSAIDDDTYDGAPESHCPVGYGATEEEAINDLKRQLQEAYEASLTEEEWQREFGKQELEPEI